MKIVFLVVFVLISYLRTFFNKFISDDVTVHAERQREKFKVRFDLHNPLQVIHDFLWKISKTNYFLHHLINFVIFSSLVISIYFVGLKYIPENIIFLACLFFIAHPCNAQVGGWISGRWYAIGLTIGLWALYFNNYVLYLIGLLFSCNIFMLPIFMKGSILLKVISILLGLSLLTKQLKAKFNDTKTDGVYKGDNLIFSIKKIPVMVKSFCYYFTLAMFPLKLGWFHEIGEPITKDLKSYNRHFWLCIVLLGSMFLFKNPAFIGLVIFGVMILPFINLITFALFTSERYMTPALIGFSIFLSYTLINYPVISTIIITAYFVRLQLELYAYKDDYSLALYSLLNFPTSGFAWANMGRLFLFYGKNALAFGILQDAIEVAPKFPTTYYQMYFMYRNKSLLNDDNKGIINLEKACKYGGHENWYKELDEYRNVILKERMEVFKENVARNYGTYEVRPSSQPITQKDCVNSLGVIA